MRRPRRSALHCRIANVFYFLEGVASRAILAVGIDHKMPTKRWSAVYLFQKQRPYILAELTPDSQDIAVKRITGGGRGQDRNFGGEKYYRDFK
jgi:hypothetical protein